MRQRLATVRLWLPSHPVEVVFGLMLVVAFAYSLRITGQSYFWADDWRYFQQAGSLGGFFEPYNNHLSLLILGGYRLLIQAFGFTFTPFRVMGMLCLLANPAAYFLTTRRQFGAALAAIVALPLLWYGQYFIYFVGELNHYLALLGAIGCAAALNRGRRADWVLAAAVSFALCSAGGGVAVVAAALVHNACTRAPVRRWLAVLVPALLWLVWWLIEARGSVDLGPFAMTTSQTLRFVRDLSYTPFESAGLGNTAVAVALIAGFVACGIWALSKGLDSGANFVAWTIALVVWGFGLANSRGTLASTTAFRYRYVALGLALLAVVPRRPIRWPAWLPIDRRWVLAAAGVVLVLGGARGLAVRGDMQAAAEQQAVAGRLTRGETVVIGLGPAVVPDRTVLDFRFGALPAGEVRKLLAEYGSPYAATRSSADRMIVDVGGVRAESGGVRDIACKPLGHPLRYQPSTFGQLVLGSPDAPFTVDVRRFGDDWVRVGRARAGEVLRVNLPAFGSNRPWEVRADGACRLAR